MGDLHEIVSVEATEHLFALLAFGLPLLGILVGAAVGVYRKRIMHYLRLGLAGGLIGPLNWLMWHVFNGLTERNGLDTVRNVFINLGVFVFVGLALGIGGGMYFRRGEAAVKAEPADVPHSPQTETNL